MSEKANAPAGEAGARSDRLGGGSVDSVARCMHLDDVVAAWAEAQVTGLLPREVEVPTYGVQAWVELPAGDARKAAAVLVAAEMWRRYGDEEALLAWFRQAWRARPPLAEGRSRAELAARARSRPAHRLRATPGWPPIRIPGKPGRYLTVQGRAA
ncbi:hypothetical protein QCN29_21230 [Streptomyces sp. HNM0663]|uniref:Uncharacterized protein n=1 Tax=Streptomyces chengmaiensis TaxID=3040919 RepID=A0ABT6HRC0_9ACTN|nr:hypothetical protein [Streptomyces chengmaiensis]MDH2391259.1 hypothetical protein [Streptomyces chengmaiensis]